MRPARVLRAVSLFASLVLGANSLPLSESPHRPVTEGRSFVRIFVLILATLRERKRFIPMLYEPEIKHSAISKPLRPVVKLLF